MKGTSKIQSQVLNGKVYIYQKQKEKKKKNSSEYDKTKVFSFVILG